jgi:hypothetical protein
MHDKELVLEVLRQIEEAAKKIITRFAFRCWQCRSQHVGTSLRLTPLL